VLIAVHPGCGFVFTLFLPLVLYLVHKTGKQVQPYRQIYHGKFREANWEMNQSLLNIRTVKDYVQEEREGDKYERLLGEYLSLAEKRVKVEASANQQRDTLLGFARFAVLFYAVYLVHQGSMTAGTLVLFATLSEKVIASLFRLGRLYSFLGDSIESIEQFRHLFDQEPDVTDADSVVSHPNPEGEVRFNDVTFEYRPGIPVLKSIELKLPARSVVAFVGRSGSGKSTMVKLLSRHYDVTQGAITLDGIDLRKMKISEFRKRIATVSQDIEVFDKSVAENIAYGVQASQEEIERAAKAAHAHDFIMNLPQGYQTRVGEKGVKLSGGQRQRVGIARALIMNPTVLVFDEATSSLDTESERLIQQALMEIAHRQTMVIIAHRLSTIENADFIAVFDQGKIVEFGTRSELMSREGFFARMQGLQSLGELRR
jgi:ABC-type multidrug transport system fused ATPase/permease subunit